MASSARDRLRKDLGDTGTPPAFADAELDTLLADAGGDRDVALRDGLWQLLSQAAKWNDYTTGQSEEKKAQVWDHLWAMYGDVKTRVQAAQRATATAARPPLSSTAVKNEFVW